MTFRPAVIFAALCIAGCASSPFSSSADGPAAVATLKPTAGNIANGTVTFTQVGNKVRVDGVITGLAIGKHGFHIHEKGDCSAADATSAGGHFNPHLKKHGDANGEDRHGGDLGNIKTDDYGSAAVNLQIEDISVSQSAANGVVGRALIVHADPDDLKTQPTGNSGKRVACAVIVAK